MCRCDERLKVKTEGSTRLTYTGFGTPKLQESDRDEIYSQTEVMIKSMTLRPGITNTERMSRTTLHSSDTLPSDVTIHLTYIQYPKTQTEY